MSKRIVTFAVILLLLLIACVGSPHLTDLAWRVKVFQRLGKEIAYIEYRPNVDWPPQRIADKDQVQQFKAWLARTRAFDPMQSAPPPLICEARIVFVDGDEEPMVFSPIKEPIQGGAIGYLDGEAIEARAGDVRGDVRVEWRGSVRSGETAELERMLAPAPMDSAVRK